MNTIKRKIHSLIKLLFSNKVTKPIKMGENILILAAAPCVKNYFEYKSVKKQFAGYDIAFINFMVVHSQKEMFDIKPKYIMLIDPVFYMDIKGWEERKREVTDVLQKINWKCILVTSVLADFNIDNVNITFHRLSCFEFPYKKILLPFYRKNLLTLGAFNIMQAALFYAITFGYKNISILGCNYQMADLKMVESGLRITCYDHYYDKEKEYEYISQDQIFAKKNGHVSAMFERAKKSAACFFSLAKYAKENNARIINYSDHSALDGFEYGELIIDEN